jgi:hypothetical protein
MATQRRIGEIKSFAARDIQARPGDDLELAQANL